MKKPLVCVDANVVINALTVGPFYTQASLLLMRLSQADFQLTVPTLFDYEVVSALRRAVHLKTLSVQAGENAYQRYLSIPIRRQHNRRLLNLSWEFANRYERSRIYDASYLAVAHLYNCELWTADKRLYNAVHSRLTWVRWIEEVS
jgi:predicted nucleic acid-binding protein